MKGHYDLFLLYFLLTDKVTPPFRIGKATVLSRTSLSACDNWLALRQQSNFSSINLLRGTRAIEDLSKCWVIGSQNRSIKFGAIWKEKASKFWLSHSTRDRQNVCPREPWGLPRCRSFLIGADIAADASACSLSLSPLHSSELVLCPCKEIKENLKLNSGMLAGWS